MGWGLGTKSSFMGSMSTRAPQIMCTQASRPVRSKIKMCRMREGSWLGSGLEEQGLAGAGQHQLWTHAGLEVVRVS